VVINFPGNPTGAVISAAQMTELLDFAKRRDLNERLVMVSGASKSYAMTAWRLGWMLADERIIEAATKLVEPVASCPSSLSQVAAETALRGGQDGVTQMRDAYVRGARQVAEILQPPGLLPVEPAGAFYALLDISHSGMGSDEFSRLLEASARRGRARVDVRATDAERGPYLDGMLSEALRRGA